MRPVRAVLFDYGHTLVDFRRTEEALREAYRQISARIEAVAYMEVPELLDLVERVTGGVERMIEESYAARRLEELDQSQLLRESFAAIGFDLPDDVLAHVVALDHSAYSNSITAEPETMETLGLLKDAGYRMGLVSNVTLLPSLMREDLAKLGFDAYLDVTVFSSEVGVRKPDPRIFRAALERLGADPAETAFVGDRRFDDVTGSQAVGMRGIQTLQFRREVEPADVAPDAVVERLSDLPGVLRAWGGP
jgi:FMN hydrolase / 5-amino-6-(5-phospho-D-ribitylamino)uracil phosphatase